MKQTNYKKLYLSAYIAACVYFMTVYDLLTFGRMVWLVYDAFYSNGAEDEETFKEMIKLTYAEPRKIALVRFLPVCAKENFDFRIRRRKLRF